MELWKACAGPLVDVPKSGERVFYFPQGHMEQVSVCFVFWDRGSVCFAGKLLSFPEKSEWMGVFLFRCLMFEWKPGGVSIFGCVLFLVGNEEEIKKSFYF